MTPLRGDTLFLPIFSPAPHKPRKLKENKNFTIPQPHTPKTPPPQHSATPHPPPIGRALIPQPGSTPRGPTAAPKPAKPTTPAPPLAPLAQRHRSTAARHRSSATPTTTIGSATRRERVVKSV